MNWQPGATRPLPAVGEKERRSRVDRSDARRKHFEELHGWDRAIERYAKTKQDRYDVNALLDFRHVEGKKAHLFYQTPEIQLLPIDPMIEGIPAEQIMPARQKVLNFKLGPDGENVKAEIHEALFDALAPSGFLCTKIGYENVMVATPKDPATGLHPMLNGTEVKEIPIWERCFWTRFSPKKLLIPDDFTSTKFDRAPWLGMKGAMPLSKAKIEFRLPDDFTATTNKDDSVFTHGDSLGDSGDPLVEYTEVFYRAAHFDPSVKHPELFRRLVLVKGMDTPAVHVDSPYQTIDPQTGRLTDDSMVGNPIHVGTLRDLSDSAYVPSDLSVGEQLSNELNKFRTSAVRGRRKRSPIVVVAETLGKDYIDKLTANEGPVPVPDQYIQPGGQTAVAVVSTGSEPRDNFTTQDYIERDHERALGSSANQQGQFTKGKRTATEARIVQGNSDARSEAERDRLREYFVAGVRKYDCVLQRFMTPQEIQKILGHAGAQVWEQWKALPGRYLYKIQPDSGVHVDAAQYRAQTLDEYNLLRKDDRVNTEELLKKVARALAYDTGNFIAPPQDKTTEPPSASVAFKGEDTTNAAMGNLLLDFCANAGIKLRPETIAAFALQHATGATPPGAPIGAEADPNTHGGSATVTEPVNQHQTERTGGVQGVGAVN